MLTLYRPRAAARFKSSEVGVKPQSPGLKNKKHFYL